MNYWERLVGDWKRDTAHLSLEQKGAYGELLDFYYANERALPNDFEALCRITGARSENEVQAVHTVIKGFFYIAEDGLYHQKKADLMIQRRRDYLASKSKAANVRWHPPGGNGEIKPDSQWRREKAQGDPGTAKRPTIKCEDCGKTVDSWTDRKCHPCYNKYLSS